MQTLIGFQTYNYYNFTYLSLKSIERNTPGLFTGEVRLIVIDNSSNDGTRENIVRDFPWVEKVINSEIDSIPRTWNDFVDMLKPGEDFCLFPNDAVIGDEYWLDFLYDDLEKNPEAMCISPYMLPDMLYDEVINEAWWNNYQRVYPEIRAAKTTEELELYLSNLYNGDFDTFCEEFRRRNMDEPPLDDCVTHLMLFKNEFFTEHKFRFNDIDYPEYYGAHEFDLRARMNNLQMYRLASSKVYAHHWVSIANADSNIDMSEKKKIIKNNGLTLLSKYSFFPGLTDFMPGPRPSRIPNWRTPYHHFMENEPRLSLEEAKKVPGIKFMVFEGLHPGVNYFNQIQPGSILVKDNKYWKVFGNKDNSLLLKKNSVLDSGATVTTIYPLTQDSFLKEQWGIAYYWRKEEEEYWGVGHMDFLLKEKTNEEN